MKKYNYFFGVDISKKRMDITCIINQEMTHRQFTNDAEDMQLFLQWLKKLSIGFDQTLFCMEVTGLYFFPLTEFLRISRENIFAPML